MTIDLAPLIRKKSMHLLILEACYDMSIERYCKFYGYLAIM
jgi:hypothetical protein